MVTLSMMSWAPGLPGTRVTRQSKAPWSWWGLRSASKPYEAAAPARGRPSSQPVGRAVGAEAVGQAPDGGRARCRTDAERRGGPGAEPGRVRSVARPLADPGEGAARPPPLSMPPAARSRTGAAFRIGAVERPASPVAPPAWVTGGRCDQADGGMLTAHGSPVDAGDLGRSPAPTGASLPWRRICRTHRHAAVTERFQRSGLTTR